MPRSRRRVAWHKGSDADEELWPAEAFNGVTDEQFWDDLAADKPLGATALTAHPDSGSGGRPAHGVPLPQGRARAADERAERSGAYPQSRSAQADRTAMQPIRAANQPSPIATQPSPAVTQPSPAVTRTYQTATQPSPIATQPVRVTHQPAESRGRPRAGSGGFADSDEDPLTSPAYSLRPKGAVDGRSYQSSRRSRDLTWEQYEAAVSRETQSFSLADTQAATGGYPEGALPFRQYELPAHGGGRTSELQPDPLQPDPLQPDPLQPDPLRSAPIRSDGNRPDPLRSDGSWSGSSGSPSTIATPVYQASLRSASAHGGTAAYSYLAQPYGEPHSMNAPSYGERYGYGNPAGLAYDPRRPDGTRHRARHASRAADGSWGPRHSYPPEYGYQAPYDPWGNARRLSSLRLPRAHWIHARGRCGLVHRAAPASGAGGAGADPQRLPRAAAGYRRPDR